MLSGALVNVASHLDSLKYQVWKKMLGTVQYRECWGSSFRWGGIGWVQRIRLHCCRLSDLEIPLTKNTTDGLQVLEVRLSLMANLRATFCNLQVQIGPYVLLDISHAMVYFNTWTGVEFSGLEYTRLDWNALQWNGISQSQVAFCMCLE